MKRLEAFSSLSNRIFLASALLAVVSIGVSVYLVSSGWTNDAEAAVKRGLEQARSLVEQQRTSVFENLRLTARLIADLPKMNAAVTTADPPTMMQIADQYRAEAGTDLFVVTDRKGAVLYLVGHWVEPDRIPNLSAVRRGLEGGETYGFWPDPTGVLEVVTVPIAIGQEVVGTLSVGSVFDDRRATEFRRITDSEIAFALEGRIRAGTIKRSDYTALERLLGKAGGSNATLGNGEYEALVAPLAAPRAGSGLPAGAAGAQSGGRSRTAVILRSRSELLASLHRIHLELGLTALAAVLLATVLSYAVARTVTRPLGAITTGMREVARTGDLTRKVALPGKWDDEDARLLATTFNTLTDSIARFQREAAQRDRLSSLGRLSTVIAHEIRNPLMIIKASLRTLRRDPAVSGEVREAVADIDEEADRLNRIVNEVLDFARPIRFEYGPVDLNALCRQAVDAAAAHESEPRIELALDASMPPLVSDAERLRAVIVNLVANARQAVLSGESATRADGAPIKVETRFSRPGQAQVIVRDRGAGIAPDVMARIFDPFFTTRRAGTGVGLAIVNNIVQGLGGSINVDSRPGAGSEFRVTLPVDSTAH
jgi:signal transduction histidine kinase